MVLSQKKPFILLPSKNDDLTCISWEDPHPSSGMNFYYARGFWRRLPNDGLQMHVRMILVRIVLNNRFKRERGPHRYGFYTRFVRIPF